MGIFEFEEQPSDSSADVSEQENNSRDQMLDISEPDVEMVKVCDTGGNGRTQLRVTVPHSVVNDIDLTGDDRVLIKATERGFVADVFRV